MARVSRLFFSSRAARFVCLLALFLVVVAIYAPAAAAGSSTRAVVIVVANRLLLEEIDDPRLASLNRMLDSSQLGLISPNCAGSKSPQAVMLTAAAGRPLKGGAFARECYDADELLPAGLPAAREHAIRTGHRARSGSAVFLDLAEALRANEDMSYSPVVLGALAAAVRNAGGRTCVVGNSDTAEAPDRSAAVLGVDCSGRADVGMLSLAAASAADPLGYLPEVAALAQAAERGLERAEVVVVDFGGFEKLEAGRMSLSDASLQRYHALLMDRLDQLTARLQQICHAQHAALVLVSFAPPEAAQGKRLTPLAIWSYELPGGVLRSPTTRTPGLIAATDFAPAILSLIGIRPPAGLQGRAASASSIPTYEAVARLDARVAAHRCVIAPLGWGFLLLGGVASVAAALMLWQPRLRRRWAITAVRIALLAIALAHAAMLVAVLAPVGAASYAAGVGVFLVVGIVFALAVGVPPGRKWGISAAPVLVAFAVTVALTLADTATGGHLMRHTAASSFQMSGMRYYGIGNEYAAALITMAAVIALFGAVLTRWRWVLAAGIGVVTVLFLGLGSLGANYGATIAAVVTFFLLVVAVRQSGFGGRQVAVAFALGMVAAVTFALLESRLAGASGSHAGRLAGMVQASGAGYLLDIIRRKTLMNLMVTFDARALKAYLLFLPLLALWIYRLRHDLRRGIASDKRVLAGFKAVAYGSLAGLLFNDSGIIMGGCMLAMAALVLLYSLLSQPEAQG